MLQKEKGIEESYQLKEEGGLRVSDLLTKEQLQQLEKRLLQVNEMEMIEQSYQLKEERGIRVSDLLTKEQLQQLEKRLLQVNEKEESRQLKEEPCQRREEEVKGDIDDLELQLEKYHDL